MPGQNDSISKLELQPDKYSAYGTNATKTDLEADLSKVVDKVNEIVEVVNTGAVTATFPGSQEGDILTVANGSIQAVRGEVLANNLSVVDINDLPEGFITAEHIADGSVSGIKIMKDSLTLEHLTDEAVASLLKVPPKSIDGGLIADGSIGVEKIADGAIPNYLTAPFESKYCWGLSEVIGEQEEHTVDVAGYTKAIFKSNLELILNEVADGQYELCKILRVTEGQETGEPITLTMTVASHALTALEASNATYFSYIPNLVNGNLRLNLTCVFAFSCDQLKLSMTRILGDKPYMLSGFTNMEVM